MWVGFPGSSDSIKNLPAVLETRVQSLGQKVPLEREWQPTPVFLPGEFHGQRNLAGCCLWDCKELDMTERLTHTHTHTHTCSHTHTHTHVKVETASMQSYFMTSCREQCSSFQDCCRALKKKALTWIFIYSCFEYYNHAKPLKYRGEWK